MGTRVLSLWLPYLAVDRIGHDGGRHALGPKHLPYATCLADHDDQPLAALCPRAEQAGLLPGMTRAEALRRVPGLLTSPADLERDARFLRTCISWCERFTPFVTVDRSFVTEKGAALWLDVGSSAHLSGGEASLLAGLLGQFQKKGVSAKAAIADHPGAAWAACRFGGDERRILPAGGARVALAPWPIEALRLEKAACDSLESAGLDRIEHLYALSRRALAERFGDRVATRLDQALGLADEPIAIDTPLPAQQAQMIFADPIADDDALPPLIARLVRQLCIGLEAAGLGARRLTLALYRVDNSTVTCTLGADHPSRDADRLAARLQDQCKAIDPGFGVERAILDAVEIEPLLSENLRWRGLGTAADEALPDLARQRREQPADRLQLAHIDISPGADHGRASTRPIPPFLQQRRGGGAPARLMASGSLALAAEAVDQPALRETPPRPLRLLRQPEPIEAIAPLPDEPPVLFRWRQRLHKVVSARGPETVAPDWWRLPETTDGQVSKGVPARDYFAVEDSEGARFWLFRDGRYGDGEGSLPRWFLHGVFG